MTELRMPSVKINPDELDIKNEEELEKIQQKERGGSRLTPGRHNVTVKDVISHKAAKKDKTWMQLEFVLEGADDKTANPRILVPFSKLKYGEKGSTFPLVQFRRFMAGFGEEFKVEETLEIVAKWFSKPKKAFVGKELVIEIGFTKAYAKFVGKDASDDSSIWHLMDKNNQPVAGEDGETAVFTGRDGVMAYAVDNKIPFQQFSDILKYEAVESSTDESGDEW